ncbi:unnamed protein product, partial [Discosporangium mesarthrocarpum]
TRHTASSPPPRGRAQSSPTRPQGNGRNQSPWKQTLQGRAPSNGRGAAGSGSGRDRDWSDERHPSALGRHPGVKSESRRRGGDTRGPRRGRQLSGRGRDSDSPLSRSRGQSYRSRSRDTSRGGEGD